MRNVWLIIGALLFLPFTERDAEALICSATVSTPLSFGSVDTLSGGDVNVSGTLEVTCGITLLDLPSLALGVAICPGIGNGSGGADSSSRFLRRDGGTELMRYQIYSDSGHQNAWGGYGGGLLFGNAPLLRIPNLSVGTHSRSWPVFLRVAGGQSHLPPGTYRSTFTGSGMGGTEIRYGSLGSALGCSALGALLNTTADFEVRASVDKNCLVSTEDLNFGQHGILSSGITTEGAVNMTCTGGTQYQVALETGAGLSAQRQMRNGSNAVNYQLFHDPQRQSLWGNLIGETLVGVGDGSVTSHPVYGFVPPQPTPPPGVYTDTVIVTVTY